MDHNNKSTFMNIVFLISLCLSIMGCSSEKETYLIPKGFVGRATVIFNQKTGVPMKYEHGRRVYEIPASGIYLSQGKPVYGILDHQYYYVDDLGKRTLLPIYEYEHKPDGTTRPIVKSKDEIGIFSDGTVGQYDDDDKAPFQFFFVGSVNGGDTIEKDDHFNKRINKLIGTNL